MTVADGATRHQARERALSLLYEAELKGVAPREVVASLAVAPDPFAAALVASAEAHRAESDRLVTDAAVGWPLERMAVVDRLVLRLAVAELLEPDGPPLAVVIDEAVELTTGTLIAGRIPVSSAEQRELALDEVPGAVRA